MITRRRVLIIDEDRRTVDRLQEQFVQSGYEAEVALSGPVGIAIVAERYMSVVILSAKVGHVEDWELVKSLKKSDPQVPVVMFNAPKVKGLSKEAAYAAVQRNAMKVWRGEGTFAALLMADPDVRPHLSDAELAELFDLTYHFKHLDVLFERAFAG